MGFLDRDLGWLAGLVEGEGCIKVGAVGRATGITIGMTDKDVIEKAASMGWAAQSRNIAILVGTKTARERLSLLRMSTVDQQ